MSGDKQVGNVAAMREALESFMVGSCIYPCVESCGYDPIDEICMSCTASPEKDGDCPYEKARKALALPLRNCDVGTAEEQNKRFEHFCFTQRSREKCCGDCQLRQVPSCELAWAQMPYLAEGGAS